MELNEKFEKYLKEKGINVKESDAKVSFTVSDMPMEWFFKFKEAAKTRFGDCYWCYIMHLMNREESSITKEEYQSLVSEIQEIKDRLMTLEDKVEKREPSGIQTLGGGE